MKNHAAMVGRIYSARQTAKRALEKAAGVAELVRGSMAYQANDLELADIRDAIRELTAASEALGCAVIVLEQAKERAALPSCVRCNVPLGASQYTPNGAQPKPTFCSVECYLEGRGMDGQGRTLPRTSAESQAYIDGGD